MRSRPTLVRAGVSPHAPYTVCGPQLELIADLALAEKLPLMMHAAESEAEELFVREGRGVFAEGLARRSIEWKPPGLSTIQYLKRSGILETRPLLAHCIRVDDDDIETLRQTRARRLRTVRSRMRSWVTGARRWRSFSRRELSLGSVVIQWRATTPVTFSKKLASRPCWLGRRWRSERSAQAIACSQHATGELKEGAQADLALSR